MKAVSVVAVVGLGFTMHASAGAAEAQMHDSDEWHVAVSVLALPDNLRGGAEVRAWTSDGALRVVRAGTNGMICLSDQPGEGLGVACYHESLEPFMRRGRELRADGIEGMERMQVRWNEAREGTLSMPEIAAMVYNLRLPEEPADPSRVDLSTAGRLHAVYIPNATPESTGLPTEPPGGSAPWLMWPGEPSSHIMISLPPADGPPPGG